MRVLKFRPKKQKEEHKRSPGLPNAHGKRPNAINYCFELVNSALKQDDKDEVAKNLLSWFIVNVDQKTLAKFIKWIVKKEDK